MSFDHILLHGCEIVEAGGMLIVPYPEFVPLNTIVYAEDVDYSDDDHNYVEEEHVADESEVQPSRKRKREGAHDKYITYHKRDKKYNVQVYKDGKRQYVGYFPTQEEAVVARDAYLRGETDSHQACWGYSWISKKEVMMNVIDDGSSWCVIQ